MELYSKSELRKRYPKCFRPLPPKLMVQSVVFPDKRISLEEWKLKIKLYKN